MSENTYTLTHGKHATREEGMCLMEAVAYLAGEPHTDAPACACPVLTAYAVNLNDAMGKGPDGNALRARYLHDLAPMLVGSRSTPKVELARAYALADHAVRVFAPMALEAAGMEPDAKRLRELQPITDEASAVAAAEAAEAAGAARAAAGGAGAAVGAAGAAAWAAGGVGAAAWAARAAAGGAGAAAGAAGAAAWAAARKALVAALEVAP